MKFSAANDATLVLAIVLPLTTIAALIILSIISVSIVVYCCHSMKRITLSIPKVEGGGKIVLAARQNTEVTTRYEESVQLRSHGLTQPLNEDNAYYRASGCYVINCIGPCENEEIREVYDKQFCDPVCCEDTLKMDLQRLELKHVSVQDIG